MEHSIKWMFYPPNDPQINVGAKLATSVTPTSSRGGPIGKKFKTNAHANSRLPSMEGGKAKHCSFNGRGSHFLEECKAFCAKKLEEGTKWVLQTGLWYRYLTEGHRQKHCMKDMKSRIHTALLHKGT